MRSDEAFVYGVLDVRDRLSDTELAERCRELTFAWSRWSYSGPIIEHDDPQTLLRLAAQRNARYCLVQAGGHLVVETLRPKGAEAPELVDLLVRALGSQHWLVGHSVAPGAIRESCWLVDLDRWQLAGQPTLRRDAGRPWLWCDDLWGMAPFPMAARALGRELQPERAAHADALRSTPERADRDSLTPELASFVDGLSRTLDRSQRGVFVWNLEGYDDVSLLEPEPLAALYCVAAGFKPNAILRRCGFRPDAQVVFLDYSRDALRFRRQLVEAWNGRDLPAFLWPRLEPSSTHYWLRSTAHDGMPDRAELEQLWQRELDDWGGADTFAAHWQATRRLVHHYVHVDLLRHPERAITMTPQGPSVVWWSNAFSSVHALWHLRYAARADAFTRWIDVLAEACPEAQLLGADADNVPVADTRAAEYAAMRAVWQGGMHEPLRCCTTSLRF
ncbi:hypothetical protein [Tahibacter amnicola]|uniref:Uncharacterized protein n=1 Tax=Tahibacter amnicola TaxID=2976241 RepID=A0ABY6BK08_9GAMM|nr:hypothetical protein [Tahibacter amnicola]UXI70097.1 hypothetical protein N4264_10850 [Tahibacter amnicola]